MELDFVYGKIDFINVCIYTKRSKGMLKNRSLWVKRFQVAFTFITPLYILIFFQ